MKIKKWILNIVIGLIMFLYVIVATQVMYKVRTVVEIWHVLLRLGIIYLLLICIKRIVIRGYNYFSMKVIKKELNVIQQRIVENTSKLDVHKQYKMLFVKKEFSLWKNMISNVEDGTIQYQIVHVTNTESLKEVIETAQVNDFVDVLIVEAI